MSKMWAHDNTITRANGRIAETLIISFDKRMSLEHRKEATERFLQEVTLGEQTKAVAFLHDNDQTNLHAHVVVLDAGSDGKPVAHFGRSGTYRREHSQVKGNPTEWLRKQWEDCCNATLEQYDYPFRVDRRTREAQLEDSITQDEPALDATEDVETSLDTTAPVSPELPVEPEAPDMAPSDEEDSMAIEREGKHPAYVHVKDGLEYDRELQHLHEVQARIKHHEEGMRQAELQSDNLRALARRHNREAMAAKQSAERAADALAGYTKPNGKLRGIHLKLGPLEWKSRKRAIGETLTRDKDHFELRHLVAAKEAKDTEYSAAVWENLARENQLSLEAHKRDMERELQTFGDKATLEQADKILNASIHAALSKVELQAIYADFENGELTGPEAKRAFELLGEHGMVAAVEQRMGIEEEQEAANDNGVEM